jgi:hypothetical protein
MIPAARTPQRFPGPRPCAALVAAILLAVAGAPSLEARAAEPNSLGNTPSGRQVWRISDYGNVQLVPREPGAHENQHPARLQPELLRAHLEGATTVVDGTPRPLFAPEELDADIGPLVEAFASARPDQDVLLISVARHEGNFLVAPTAITARLFVANGRLNLLVRDARTEFYDKVRGTNMTPTWHVGSRTTPGKSVLARAGATSPRPDWLVFDLAATPVATAPAPEPASTAAARSAPLPAPAYVQPPAPPAPAAAPAVVAAPAAVTPPPPITVPAPAKPAATTPMTHPALPSTGEAEQRLETLKRLFDKGLITQDEYMRKRKEIIDAL